MELYSVEYIRDCTEYSSLCEGDDTLSFDGFLLNIFGKIKKQATLGNRSITFYY